MKKVTILALDNSLASSVTGTMDIFSQVGLTWNHINHMEPEPVFEVSVVTQGGNPVSCLNQFLIYPQGAAEDVKATDLLIISSISDFSTLDSNKDLLPWIHQLHLKGTTIASICTGSFFLAQTGLLDGKTATTHWGFAAEFQNRYPKINLLPAKLITDEGNLLCSGACNSYVDLSIYLIERYCGNGTAINCSKTLVHDFARSSQTPYSVFNPMKDHQDDSIKTIQAIFEKNPEYSFSPKILAKEFGMSRRTFERRFKAATGCTPLLYVQRLRIEKGKNKLETTSLAFDEIAYDAGYEDSNFFRKIFKKHTGLLPGDYRSKFQR